MNGSGNKKVQKTASEPNLTVHTMQIYGVNRVPFVQNAQNLKGSFH